MNDKPTSSTIMQELKTPDPTPPDQYFYSNVIQMAVSNADLRFVFAENVPNGVNTKAGIVLSPETAAQLLIVLARHLPLFEDRFGQIRNPEWQANKELLKLPPLEPNQNPS